MSVTIPSLDTVTDILDTDKIMVTQSSGQTYTIDGASFNKRNQAVIANSTTLTGAPLKTGNIVRAYFTADITGVNTTTGLVLNYNGSNKNVKVPKDGALANFTAQNMGGSPTVYKYLQAYTTLELLYDGTNFVIIGNPVVISSSDYTIYADGKTVKVPTSDFISGSDKPITSGAMYNCRWKYANNFVHNTAVCSESNLYVLEQQAPSGYCYHLSGWIKIKAGTYLAGTTLFTMPRNCMINNLVLGATQAMNPIFYQFYCANNSKDVVFNWNATFTQETLIQFNQDIITYNT